METSSEFRSVHAAKEALAQYKASGNSILVIRNIPLKAIKRYDVWQCVFEKEPAALKELYIKEYYDFLSETKNEGEVGKITSHICLKFIMNSIEFSVPISSTETICLILDVLGLDFLKYLRETAKWSYDTRMEIVKPYFKPDNEWVAQAKKALDILENWK